MTQAPDLPYSSRKLWVAAAEHGIAVDRFAREIEGILKAPPARSQQLNASPAVGRHH
jgi:hypothetical protein